MSGDSRDPRTFFGPRAAAYRTSATHANAEDLARMIRLVAPRDGERALDVATGGGHTALALARSGASTVATDVTREMLDALREDGLRLAFADAQALPFRDASFDIVASRIAPHHFRDLARFAREAARVLAPRGRLYVFDLTTPEDDRAAALVDRIERLRDPSHVESHRPSRWKSALREAGLAVEHLETSRSELALGAWIRRAEMPPGRERELRALLAGASRDALGGYGLLDAETLAVLRIELVARRG